MALSLIDSIRFDSTDTTPVNYESFSHTKKMIYLVHQFLLTDYLIMFAGSLLQKKPNAVSNESLQYTTAAPLLLREYRRSLLEKAFQVPSNDFSTGRYVYIHEAMDAIATGNMPSTDTLIDLLMDNEILNTDPELFYIPKEFLLPFVHSVNGSAIDPDRISDQSIYNESGTNAYKGYEIINPLFYVPRFTKCETGLCILLQLDSEVSFPLYKVDDFNDLRTKLSLPYRYLAAMDWRGKQFSHALGILEQFSLEHDAHVMQNDHVCTIGDICHDVVTGSDYCKECKPANLPEFISFCKYLHDTWGIMVEDTVFLGEILKHSDYTDPNIINYLQKPSDDITVAEMESFKRSGLATFVNKVISATEADDPIKDKGDEDDDTKAENTDAQASDEAPQGEVDSNAPADEAGEDGAITNDTTGGDDSGLGDAIDDMGGDVPGSDDIGEDPDTENEEEDPTDKVERKIPPAIDGILLELLNPENETLADHLYRKEFLIRVNDLLQQSNPRYSSRTLFMLKEWATKWLYIFSVASLKSFLKNIHFTNMDK